MRNLLMNLSRFCRFSINRFQFQIGLALVVLTLATTPNEQSKAQVPPATPQPPATTPQPPVTTPQPPATTPQPPVNNAPPELINLLSQIDAAASQRNVEGVMQFYSPNFTHSDGLTRQSMSQALTQLWQRYPQLKYQTTVQSWKNDSNAIVAETTTKITSAVPPDPTNTVFDATIKSRQRYENGKIVQQEILAENTQLRTGDKPPTVEVKLPQQVKTGQQYNFDAIVQEPLGEEYLLGAVVEEPIKPENYLNPSRVDLELLSSGGLFKVGRAPSQPSDQWISAILIRGDGMTMITQRLNVEGKSPAGIKPAVKN